MDENDAFIDCKVCTGILGYLKSLDDSIELRKLDGYMRTKDVTTANYHVNKHLMPLDLVKITKRGTIKKKDYVKITSKGLKLIDKTLIKE